jgi:hypothetical protein
MKRYNINKLLDFFAHWKEYTNPTEFYCEGWLTRLLILSITESGKIEHDLFVDNKFFSEASLYSPFLPRFQKDPLAETHTHADGAIGDFKIGDNTNKSALKLTGSKLTIIEAKIFSEFSPNITHASFYNQAARYIACITETIDRADKIKQLKDLSLNFYLLVPEEQYNNKKSSALDKNNIRKVVQRRVYQYKKEDDYAKRKLWLNEVFEKILDKIVIKPISFEDIISELKAYRFFKEIEDYYQKCLYYNKPKS